MIYEQAMLEHNYVTEIEACLLDIGFVKVPGDISANPPIPDKYYWGPDTRREFYLYFNGDGAVRNMSCHITTDEGDYDYQLSPWVQNPCISMASWTRLYGGGIRFGIRARYEFLAGLGERPELLTDYKIGYRNEEFYAGFTPALWFAIIAPEYTGDQWIYVVYQAEWIDDNEKQLDPWHSKRFDTGSVFTEEFYANQTYKIVNDEIVDSQLSRMLNGNSLSILGGLYYVDDNTISGGIPTFLQPFIYGELIYNEASTLRPVRMINVQKVYRNLTYMYSKYESQYGVIDRILTYNKKSYIILSSNGLVARLN